MVNLTAQATHKAIAEIQAKKKDAEDEHERKRQEHLSQMQEFEREEVRRRKEIQDLVQAENAQRSILSRSEASIRHSQVMQQMSTNAHKMLHNKSIVLARQRIEQDERERLLTEREAELNMERLRVEQARQREEEVRKRRLDAEHDRRVRQRLADEDRRRRDKKRRERDGQVEQTTGFQLRPRPPGAPSAQEIRARVRAAEAEARRRAAEEAVPLADAPPTPVCHDHES